MSDTTLITHGIYNIDHDVNYRQVSESAIQWFFTKFDLHNPSYLITLNLTRYDNLQCWGESFQVDDLALKRREYVISVATDQNFRDFIATLMHELVHVHQWELDKWEGDGEKEAEQKQYELADEFWKEGLIK
jgi:hypothetical protein